MRNALPVFAIFCIVLFLSCAFEKADFSEAEKKNTVEAYEAFLQKHPQGEFSEEATERIHQLAFQLAKQKDSLHIYQKYQTKYPESKFSSDVSNRIEELEYQFVKQKDSLHVYKKFKQAYPESRFLVEVDSCIEELTYQFAKQKDEMQTYQAFLKEFPESKYVRDIKKSIHNLSLPTYSDVLRSYPKYVKLTYTETKISDVGPDGEGFYFKGGNVEIRNGEYLIFHYGAKLTVLKKIPIYGKIYLPGDKLTLDKDLNIVKVRSWK